MTRNEAERWHTGQTGLHPANPGGHKPVRGWEKKMDDIITVALTREEADALHNHVPGPALVRAQTKIRKELVAQDEVDALNMTERVRKVQGHGIEE